MRVIACALFLVVSAFSSFSFAAQCGGRINCRCGDVVVSDYQLPTHLICTADTDGLRINAGVTVDLNTFRIQGPVGSTRTGVIVAGANAIIKNGVVYRFRRGVRLLSTATNARVINVTSQYNSWYNFEVNGADQRLTGVISRTPGDEHFHIAHAAGVEVDNCKALGTAKEVLYVLDSEGEYTCAAPVGQTLIYSDHTDSVSGAEYIVQCKIHAGNSLQCDTEVRP